jgi:hypothetical protein
MCSGASTRQISLSIKILDIKRSGPATRLGDLHCICVRRHCSFCCPLRPEFNRSFCLWLYARDCG